MTSKYREASIIAGAQTALFAILCVNFRAIAEADYAVALISDALVASMQFFVIRRIAQDDDQAHRFAGYVIGSVLGSWLGIWISKTYL